MKTGYDQFFQQKKKASQDGFAQPSKSTPKFQMKHTQEFISNVKPRSSRELAEELRLQMKSKKNHKKPKSIPWKVAGFSFLGLLLAAFGLLNMEELEKNISRIEISIFGSAFAEEAPVKKAEATPAEAKKEEAKNVSLSSLNVEETEYYKKLNDRKRDLDAREEELNRMESELQAQREALEKRLQELGNTRREISSVLEEKVQTDDKKVDSLVQMYSNMKPAQAAKVFENMDEALAVEILGRMKKKNAAEIMNLIKAEKAQVFSEKYAGYRK